MFRVAFRYGDYIVTNETVDPYADWVPFVEVDVQKDTQYWLDQVKEAEYMLNDALHPLWTATAKREWEAKFDKAYQMLLDLTRCQRAAAALTTNLRAP